MKLIEKFNASVTARFFLYGVPGGVNEKGDDGGGYEKGCGINPEDSGCADRGNQRARQGSCRMTVARNGAATTSNRGA